MSETVTRRQGDKETGRHQIEPPASLSPCRPVSLSPLRAWCYLIWLSLQRQARARQMVWIALGLLVFATALVAINTAGGRWGMDYWRMPRRFEPATQQWADRPTYRQWVDRTEALAAVMTVASNPAAAGVQSAVFAANRAVLQESGFFVFSSWVIFPIYLSFLLPIWSLSFATEALGAEREGSSLVWLLTRPLSRPAIYLAKFVALLPWSLGLNLGGPALLCVAAGKPGALAFRLYWPAVFWATLAFSALFHLMGASFRRSAVVAIVYSFFLETLLGNMPGYMKRVSIGFYTRCMMFDSAGEYGMQPESPHVYMPVDGVTAMSVLIVLTVLLLLLGMVVFSRSEYQDLT